MQMQPDINRCIRTSRDRLGFYAQTQIIFAIVCERVLILKKLRLKEQNEVLVLCENTTSFLCLNENTAPTPRLLCVCLAAVHYNQLHNVGGSSSRSRTSSTPFSDQQLLGHHAANDRHRHHPTPLPPI